MPPIDPTIAERIKARPRTMRKPRNLQARGLSDARKAREYNGYRKGERPTS